MEIAFAFFLVAALGVFPVIGLVAQIYRDSRGKKRNLAMRCYACDSGGILLPVPHYKGDTFWYCLPCTKKQRRSERFLGYGVLLVAAAGLIGWAIISRG